MHIFIVNWPLSRMKRLTNCVDCAFIEPYNSILLNTFTYGCQISLALLKFSWWVSNCPIKVSTVHCLHSITQHDGWFWPIKCGQIFFFFSLSEVYYLCLVYISLILSETETNEWLVLFETWNNQPCICISILGN